MYLSKQKTLLFKLLILILPFLLCGEIVLAQAEEIQFKSNFSDESILQTENRFAEKIPVSVSENLKDSFKTTIKHSQDIEQLKKDSPKYFKTNEERILKIDAFTEFVSKNESTESFENKESISFEGIESISFEDKESTQIDVIRLPKKNKSPRHFNKEEKFHWRPAIIQSLYFLGIQQGFRMVQKKTRRELDGEFFDDWGQSVRNLGGWRDGDSFATNYIAHPMQGAVTGRIFINNSDRSKKLEFGNTKEYWQSRAKAMLWSAIWSIQFELGPISEASIGNVGLYDRTGPNLMGWVDIVVTPIAGTGAIVGEDLVDKYILRKWLERGSSRARVRVFRTFLTPFQSFTNVLNGKYPWHRDNR